jgi:hypothetical protein
MLLMVGAIIVIVSDTGILLLSGSSDEKYPCIA